MAQLSLQVPDDLHRKVVNLAKKQGVSVDRFFLYSISSIVANLEAQSFFEKKKQSTEEAITAGISVLNKVQSRPVLCPDDELGTGSS